MTMNIVKNANFRGPLRAPLSFACLSNRKLLPPALSHEVSVKPSFIYRPFPGFQRATFMIEKLERAWGGG